jgi:hypothetical protein
MLLPLVLDLEVVWLGLVGKTAASAKLWSFVLRFCRRRGGVSSDSACRSRSLYRSVVAGMGFSCVGVREIWCSGARFVACGGGSGVFLDWFDWRLRIWSRQSTGSAPVDAPQRLRLAGHGGVLLRLTKPDQAMVLCRSSGKMVVCFLLRRLSAAATGGEHGFGCRETLRRDLLVIFYFSGVFLLLCRVICSFSSYLEVAASVWTLYL